MTNRIKKITQHGRESSLFGEANINRKVCAPVLCVEYEHLSKLGTIIQSYCSDVADERLLPEIHAFGPIEKSGNTDSSP